jgi:HD-like signal output (HDOD) protein
MDHLHTGRGYMLMKRWNLPEKYAQVARDHHQDALDAENYLALTVRLADKACNKLGIGLRRDSGVILIAAPEAKELHLSELDIAKMEIMLEDSQVFENRS